MTQAQTAADEEFCAEQILKARHRIGPFVHCTPVLTSSSLDSLCAGKKLFFKCENFQNTGSFKCRGAMNAVLCALERQPTLTGVVTHSSGNHGQALAWAARQKQLPCVVVVPENTPTVKLDAICAYGARLVNCEATMAARWATCEQISRELGYTIVDPHNDLDVMAGQGTVAAELMEQVPQLDAIIVSVGGGGLASGIATFAKSTNNNIKVFCAELEGKGLQRQLESGRHEPSEGMAQSVADGIRVIQIGPNCFGPLVRHAEKTVFSLNEEEIRSATLLLWQRLKVVVEPSAALPLAAVLRETTGGSEALKDCGRIRLILCGGNVHIDQQKMFGGGK